jgi:hypothetical protein
MTVQISTKPLQIPILGRRTKVTINAGDLVATSHFDSHEQFPLIVKPKLPDVNLAQWILGQQEFVRQELRKYGAMLFREFRIDSPVAFRACAEALSPELLHYTERAAPRKEIDDRIYTSTEYPADQCIPLHHEMSYSHKWPLKIWFYCDLPAIQGGCTPITNDREVSPLIDPRIREQFRQKKVMYVRNFGEGADLSWMEAFQTDDRSKVEKYFNETGIEFEWRSRNRLRTRQVRQAEIVHPETGDLVWFNHAHMFHVSNLDPAVRRALLSEFRQDELPRNAFYGDGSPIADETLESIRATYSQAAVRFPWHKGDILLADNILVSHGRDAFSSERRTLVAMAEMYTNPDLPLSDTRPILG